MSDALQFKVLGPMSIARDGDPLLVRAPLQRRLLAALLASSGRVVTLEALAEEVWDEAVPDNARNALMVYLHRLRRALGSDRRIIRESTGYRMLVTADDFDAKAFEQWSAAARTAWKDGRLEHAAEEYSRALALWHGEPYADVPSPGMVAAEALRLSERRSLVHQESLELRLDLGLHATVIGEFEALARDHPFRERLTALRAVALYRAGRQAEALQVFRESRKALREEMGIDPGLLLQRVHDAILHGDERLDTVSTDSIEGEWAPPAEARIEVRPAAAVTPRELPADVAAFTGRASELRELEAARLGDEAEGIPPSPIVVLSGMAGVGKTASAVHWSRQVAPDYPDGQLFLDLRGYSAVPALRPIEALAAMLRSLGLADDQVPVDVDQAAARLRTETADRRMLVLLDNARSAEQVAPLLPGGPGSLVIVTSRNRLGDLLARHGGVNLALAPLASEEAVSLLKSLLRLPRSALDRDIDQLARRCGYLPLALRIAAANLADRPHGVGEYTDRHSTGDFLAALQIGDGPETAVKATFERSYAAQPEEARLVFRMFGLAPVGSLSVDALAAVAGTDWAAADRAAAQLVNANMANRDERGRLSLHDLVRDFANGLVGADDPLRAEALERLFAWYLETADAASASRYPANARLLDPVPPQGRPRFETPEAATRWLEEEREQLIAIARFAAEHGHGSVAWRLADALRAHAWASMDRVDFLALADAALDGARQERSVPGEAVAELCLSTAYAKAREFGKVVEHAGNAAELSTRIGWVAGQASAHHNMTLACWLIGRPRVALEHGQAALAINRAHGRLRGQSVNLGALSAVYGMLGDLRRKVRLRTEGLRIAEEIGDVRLRESHLCGLVSASVELGDMATAERHMDEVMKIETASGSGELTPLATGSLAELYSGLGKHEDALPYAEAVARAGMMVCDRRHESDGLVAVAFSLNRLERHAEAVDAADRALRSVKTDLKGTEMLALIERAIGRLGLRQTEAARQDAAAALGMALEVGDRIREGLALNVLAEAALSLGEAGPARERAERAGDLLGAIGHFAGETWSLWLRGAIARAEGDDAGARRFQVRVEDAFAKAGVPVPTRFDFGPQ
ncbi:AfsR/SARP family transcriptional regulator [Glycomyces algeriensis]|uniref:SARP family transcriptional regulator n=1 Tax=Glycomyces algeriensis TaxID=256037 RepID=A0A9W6LHW2_9ACTN|nr:AfsR/SARP family transcriptional regulator [Glycomyces algeriensis]MDA1365590.1 BTAD domain-containing putative transcriptional regulator [Glycomyces algeriensis]MDR7351278.1 DNA-binding SARP family transcriptional activator [Glycomyces algeriensis]GLI43993.1 SARP family transcriptional regulator [Glycomyces algeriensis]